MKNNTESSKNLSTRLEEFFGDNFSHMELALYYGSRKEQSDKDIFVLVNTSKPLQKRVNLDDLDLFLVTPEDLMFRLAHWDLEYTEPVLTGDYICGNEKTLDKLRNHLTTNSPGPETLYYLELRCLETYLQAGVMRDQGLSEMFYALYNGGASSEEIASVILQKKEVAFPSAVLLDAVHHLTFSLSYLAFRQRYEDFTAPVTLKEIIENPQTEVERELVKVRDYYKSPEKLTLPLIKRFFRDTEKMIQKYVYNGGG